MPIRFHILALALFHLMLALSYGEGGSPNNRSPFGSFSDAVRGSRGAFNNGFGQSGLGQSGLGQSGLGQSGFGPGGFGGGGFGGGGFGGGGFGGGGMGGGGGSTYKPNPLTQEILKKGEETSKEIAKSGEAATKAIAESTKNSQQAIETVLNQTDKTPDIIKNLIDKQKEQDEQKAKSLEAENTASAEQQKRLNDLIDNIVVLKNQTLEASIPPMQKADIRVDNPSTGAILSQMPSRYSAPSNFGAALSARDRTMENKANNTTPSGAGNNFSGGNSSGGSHGFKSNTSKVYNPPAKDDF